MCLVADGVDDRIESGRIRARDVGGHRGLVNESEREVAREAPAGVRRLHEETVDERLHAAEADESIVAARPDARGDGVAPRRQRQERVDAHAELVATLQLAEELEV